MLLFQKRFHEGLRTGAITLTFRRWQKPHVKPGGRYRSHPIGVLACDAIDRIPVSSITDAEAHRAGFPDRTALLAYLRSAPGASPLHDATLVWRVQLHHAGEADHVDLALQADLSPLDVDVIRHELVKLDARSRWTARTLALIETHPRIAASQLARKLRRETLPFKTDVRKLKKLGLTQSYEVGYDLTPRGRAYLAATRKSSSRGP